MLSLFVLIFSSFAIEPSESIVQVWVEKQPIQSVALFRLSEEYQIPLWVQTPKTTDWGTGCFWNSQLIVTNYHVIQGATALGVQALGQEIQPATIRFAIPDLDIAWLQIEEPQPIFWTREKEVQEKETVFVGGFAESQQWSQQEGTIIAHNQKTILADEKQSFLIFDQAVPPGFSGGPVWNKKGALVGLMTATNPKKDESYVISMAEMEEGFMYFQRQTPMWGILGAEIVGDRLVAANPYSPAKDLPLGQITKYNDQKISVMQLQAELTRVRANQEIILEIENRQYSIKARSVGAWPKESQQDSCQWKGGIFHKEKEGLRLTSVSHNSEFFKLGAIPNDLFVHLSSCEELELAEQMLLQIERDAQLFYVVKPPGQ